MTKVDQTSLVVSVPEAARLLGISRTHAYELVTRGELAHVRLGRRIVIPRHAIDTLLGVPAHVGAPVVNPGIGIVADGETVRLEIGTDSDAARRRARRGGVVGPRGLALTGEDVDGRWVATTNARDLAVASRGSGRTVPPPR